MKTNFTQIYEKTQEAALKLLEANQDSSIYDPMPLITDPEQTLHDIYNGTYTTPVMQWILKYAEQKD